METLRGFTNPSAGTLVFVAALALLAGCGDSPTEPEAELCPPGQLIDSVGSSVETGEPAILLCRPIIVSSMAPASAR